MELTPPESLIRWKGAARLIPSRYPVVGLLDRVAAPEDLDAIFQLEAWTNDRINAELGYLHVLPRDEWVTGKPMSTVVMAAYCHPRPGGGRFSSENRGAWYAARTLTTALAESVYHRSRELAEIGAFDTRVQMRVYFSDLSARFHDIRVRHQEWHPLYDPDDYTRSQSFARALLASGSNGVVYKSVRDPAGECVACFRPALVGNVRVGGHYEYVWSGTPQPEVRKL
jgi:RES domain